MEDENIIVPEETPTDSTPETPVETPIE